MFDACSTVFHTLTERATLTDVTKELVCFLRNQIVSPIVDRPHPPRSRIWWCPTAKSSLCCPCTLLVRIARAPRLHVSSYTPTLTVLVRARRCRDPSDVVTRWNRLIVGCDVQHPERASLSLVIRPPETKSAQTRRSISQCVDFRSSCGPSARRRCNERWGGRGGSSGS
jgi:hypothetical protein